MISDSSVFVCRLRVRIGAVRASNRGEELMLMKRFMALLLAMFMWGQAVAEEPMKTLHVQGDDAFWRAHPEIPHEEAWYAAETDALTMLLETQADAVMLALYNDELQPLLAAEALADLSGSDRLTAEAARMHPWVRQLVTDEAGRLRALPVSAILRPVYWYQDAWDAAGLTVADAPTSFEELLDFLDAWAKAPRPGVCVSHLTRFNMGKAQYNYGAWLLEILLSAHEMQQRHAGERVDFETEAFIRLAERARETGLALYRAESKQAGEKKLQLFQSDLAGGEHANNGRPEGLSHTVPLRLTADQPALTYAAVEVVALRSGTLWLAEGFALLEHLAGRQAWWRQYSLYADFAPGKYAYEGSSRVGCVDAGWLADYAAYEGEIVAYPRALYQRREGPETKNRLLLQFMAGDIAAPALAKGLNAALE